MIVIGYIVLGIIAAVFFALWRGVKQDEKSAIVSRDFYSSQNTKTENQARNVGMLLAKGWVATESWSGWPENWKFQAPDEDEPRKYDDAVHRQNKLDEIARYNLPKEYEAMNDKTKA
jgi:Tfp pilus assembly protein PilW